MGVISSSVTYFCLLRLDLSFIEIWFWCCGSTIDYLGFVFIFDLFFFISSWVVFESSWWSIGSTISPRPESSALWWPNVSPPFLPSSEDEIWTYSFAFRNFLEFFCNSSEPWLLIIFFFYSGDREPICFIYLNYSKDISSLSLENATLSIYTFPPSLRGDASTWLD